MNKQFEARFVQHDNLFTESKDDLKQVLTLLKQANEVGQEEHEEDEQKGDTADLLEAISARNEVTPAETVGQGTQFKALEARMDELTEQIDKLKEGQEKHTDEVKTSLEQRIE